MLVPLRCFHCIFTNENTVKDKFPIHIPYIPSESRVDTVDRTLAAREELVNYLTVMDKVLIQAEPVAILDRRLKKVGNVAAVFVLVHWSNSSDEDAT
ncbi:hypothetical protein Tco_1315487 [Tanacetum coccineum]